MLTDLPTELGLPGLGRPSRAVAGGTGSLHLTICSGTEAFAFETVGPRWEASWNRDFSSTAHAESRVLGVLDRPRDPADGGRAEFDLADDGRDTDRAESNGHHRRGNLDD